MIDSRPWHTVRDTRAELDEARAKQAQAEDAQQTTEGQARRAEERATREADRADGAEAHVLALLIEFAIDTTDLPAYVVDRIAEALHDDLNGGLAVDRLTEVARGHVNGYLEERS